MVYKSGYFNRESEDQHLLYIAGMVHLELPMVVVLWLGACYGGSGEKTPLYFSYITTEFAKSALPVVELALEQINNRTDILPNYTLIHTRILDVRVSLQFIRF